MLIFKFGIVSQHFAYLTCLLSIFALKIILEKFKMPKDEINRIIALLLVFQLAMLYLFAAIWKINSDYFTGMQMLQHLRGFLVFPNHDEPSPVYLLILSVGGIAAELLLAFQFFYRGKTLYLIQSFGFLFHFLLVFMIGEDLRISYQIIIFSLAALAIYPLSDRKNWTLSRSIVFWDASCSFCKKSVDNFQKIDVTSNFQYLSNSSVSNFNNLPFKPAVIEETIIVWDQDSNKYWIKSKAIMYILTDNYIFWFAKPLLYLPLIYRYTDKIYDLVARQRSCNI
jgi:predicted DCC family thiol-disulfide oxidoreductase YuxK